MIVVHEDLCPQDHKCPLVPLCPQEAIMQVNFNAPFIIKEKCIDCGICIDNCPKSAVEKIEE